LYEVTALNKTENEFTCSKCEERFFGVDSFHGEHRVTQNGVKNIQLCMKCSAETIAFWKGEYYYLRGQVEWEIRNCTREHGVNRYANERRVAYEKELELMDNCVMFNGYNNRTGYGRDMSSTEVEARRIVHGEFKINYEEQIKLSGPDYHYVVDG
jgi:hypothetical protein